LRHLQIFMKAITELGKQLPGSGYSVHGLGSLAGAHFEDGPPMTGLISEILLQNGAGRPQNGKLSLPLRTVDLNKGLFQGHATPGKCPTLVTNELLLVAQKTETSKKEKAGSGERKTGLRGTAIAKVTD
jgi:hypothetical protein